MRSMIPTLPVAVGLLLLGSNLALAQSSPSVQLCQVALGEKVSLDRGRSELALESSETYPISRGIEGVRGKAVLSRRVDLTTLSERVDFNCRVDTSAGRVIEVTYTPEPKAGTPAAKVPAILPTATPSEFREAVKACQDWIRNKIKNDHGDVNMNFESVETDPMPEVVSVKGRVRKSKGGDSATLQYVCRVEKATGIVKRGEYAKEP